MEFAKSKAKEMELNLDENLIKHLGFLFKRDPLVIFKSRVKNIDINSTEHFEVPIFIYYIYFFNKLHCYQIHILINILILNIFNSL